MTVTCLDTRYFLTERQSENEAKKNQETFHESKRKYAEFENKEKELKFKERRGCSNSLLQTNLHKWGTTHKPE